MNPLWYGEPNASTSTPQVKSPGNDYFVHLFFMLKYFSVQKEGNGSMFAKGNLSEPGRKHRRAAGGALKGAAVRAHADRWADGEQRRAKNHTSLNNKTLPSSHSLAQTRCHFIYQLIIRLALAKSAYLAQQCRGFGSFTGQISCVLEPRARIHSQNYCVLSK